MGKEDYDIKNVSEDSLEVIVIKKSLEKKCEKIVSGKNSKIPRECTKETKLTKMHKRRKTKFSKSRTYDNEDIINQDESLDKKEKSAQSSKTPGEDKDDNERMIKSQYQQDTTDSTSPENMKQVIVTAMVHKDQMSDTPKSTLKIVRDMNFDDLKNKTIETESTKKTSRDISFSDKNKVILSHKVAQDASEEKLQRVTQESTQTNEGVQDEKTNIPISKGIGQKKINDKIQGKNLNIFIICKMNQDRKSVV